jgi:prepilin-type N-terminal cleavage/methylation domain-containing protein
MFDVRTEVQWSDSSHIEDRTSNIVSRLPFGASMATRNASSPALGRPAFSLLELVLVIALLAMLAAVAVPRYAGSLSRYRADLAAKRIAADLGMTRNNAFASGTHRTATFTTATNSYVLVGIRGLDQATTDNLVSVSANPYFAQLFSADFAGGSSVIFDAYGVPDHGGSVVVRSGSFQKTVTVDAGTGNVSVQ